MVLGVPIFKHFRVYSFNDSAVRYGEQDVDSKRAI